MLDVSLYPQQRPNRHQLPHSDLDVGHHTLIVDDAAWASVSDKRPSHHQRHATWTGPMNPRRSCASPSPSERGTPKTTCTIALSKDHHTLGSFTTVNPASDALRYIHASVRRPLWKRMLPSSRPVPPPEWDEPIAPGSPVPTMSSIPSISRTHSYSGSADTSMPATPSSSTAGSPPRHTRRLRELSPSPMRCAARIDPALAALEESSKLSTASVCSHCTKRGANFPRCPRCDETWCSRDCRISSNNGKKHICTNRK